MKYGFDLDDTLSDTATVINRYAKKFDKDILGNDGKMKNISTSKDYYYFADALDWNKDNIRDFFDMYYLDVISNVEIKPYIKETLKKLKNKGNDIYVITARRKKENDIVKKITKEWLKNNQICYDKLLINIKEKSEIINQFNIDYFIDDSYSNCMEVIKKTQAKVFMIENDFNKNINDKRIKKIKDIRILLKEGE